MTARWIDGKQMAASIREALIERVQACKGRGVEPGLAVVLIGDDPASEVYVRNKEKAALALGMRSNVLRLPATISHVEALQQVRALAADRSWDGILVQWPVPSQIDYEALIEAIPPDQDADGFHPMNAGRLASGMPGRLPCTPRGIMEMLQRIDFDPAGKQAVVIGRSRIVGKPMAYMLLAADATVTICHSRTPDLAHYTKDADLVVAAAGSPYLLKRDMVRKGAVVIDVGMNRLQEKLVGDVDPAVAEVADWLTPVPGGVGPMTIAMLLKQTVEQAEMRAGLQDTGLAVVGGGGNPPGAR